MELLNNWILRKKSYTSRSSKGFEEFLGLSTYANFINEAYAIIEFNCISIKKLINYFF